MILRDAGEKSTFFAGSCPEGSGIKEEVSYQGVRFDIAQLPEIADWVVGEEYELIIRVKETEHSIDEEEGKVKERARFEIRAVGAYEEPEARSSKLAKEKLGLR
jgi:hypothetical protein